MTLKHKFGPYNGGLTTQFAIDEYGTYFAYMDSHSKSIKYEVLEYDYRYSYNEKLDIQKQMMKQIKKKMTNMHMIQMRRQAILAINSPRVDDDEEQGKEKKKNIISKVCNIF